MVPTAKYKLRQLKLERIKDWLLMEEEYVTNQERLKPQEERNEEVRRPRVRGGAGAAGCAAAMLGRAPRGEASALRD